MGNENLIFDNPKVQQLNEKQKQQKNLRQTFISFLFNFAIKIK